MMNRWPIALLSLLAVALAGYSGFLSMENRKLKDQLAAASRPIERSERPQERRLDEPVTSVESEAPAELNEGRPSRFEGFENLSREEVMERRREMRAAQIARALETFEDPELRMDMIERQMQRLDRSYADFFKRLNLPPEELDALKTLMAERSLLRMEAGIRSSGANAEERQAIREDFSAKSTLLSDDIDNLLGEENAKELAQYTNTLQYRGEVENFERSLSYTRSPLSEGQSEGLINAFAEVDRNFEYTVDLDEMRGRGRGGSDIQLTKEVIDTYYEERGIYDAMLLEQASKVLNDAQLASLAEQQVAERERDYRQAQQALENPAPADGRGGFGRGGFGGFQSGRGGPGSRGR